MSRLASDTQIPYDVQVALVEASGKLFWHWDDYRHCLRKAGVHPTTVARLTGSGASKYQVMRDLLAELDRAGTPGRQVQVQLVRGMIALPLTDDSTDAKAAQTQLRAVADKHGLLPETQGAGERAEERVAARKRKLEAEKREAARSEASAKRKALFAEFCQLLGDLSDKQGRGYRLEEMIGEVAALDGLQYVPPFRKGTATQTDGILSFEGFQYLIEARWRDEPADVAAIAALAMKADRNLTSTRGLFLSMSGFRDEVVAERRALRTRFS
ncbi:MAG: hypothetical protein M0T77_02255 [Actinomycetota bacterium]|nr:hypothetical protein [Actinomycetota bacterium]